MQSSFEVSVLDHLEVVFLILGHVVFLELINHVVLSSDELLGLDVLKAEDSFIKSCREDVTASSWTAGRVVGVHEVRLGWQGRSRRVVDLVVTGIVRDVSERTIEGLIELIAERLASECGGVG